MGATSINIGQFGIDSMGSDKPLLIARPDMRIVKFSFLAPAIVLAASVILYLAPLRIDRDLHLAGSILIATLGLGGVSFLLVLYEALSKAAYALTDGYIEEEYGIMYKRLRRIPLSYVRDVTHDQNFFQAMFRVSSITVSPTNGDKIVLSNIRDGEQTRETIWQLVLASSPTYQRQT
jgi:hypothetical protein